jgi:membrane-bound ClpP family serine protease
MEAYLKKDILLIAGILGALATIPAEFITQVGKLFGINKYSDYQLSSILVTINRPSIIMGFIVEATVGAIVSILLFYMLNKLGQEHTVIKCLLGGIVLWLLEELVLTAFIEGRTIPIGSMGGYYMHLIGAITFGLTDGILLRRYLFRKFSSQ